MVVKTIDIIIMIIIIIIAGSSGLPPAGNYIIIIIVVVIIKFLTGRRVCLRKDHILNYIIVIEIVKGIEIVRNNACDNVVVIMMYYL